MPTIYLELPPDELDPLPGLMQIEAGHKEVEQMKRLFNAVEVTKERALEILTNQGQADGYSEEEARELALEDLEEQDG